MSDAIWELLEDGYGVEDVAVKTGLTTGTIRQIIQEARRHNRIHTLLGTDRERNRQALEIMGVRRG